MSIFYCVGCQNYRDLDFTGINDGEDGQYCDDCFLEKVKNTEIEEIQKQVDENSIEIFEIDKRVKKLEGGKSNE